MLAATGTLQQAAAATAVLPAAWRRRQHQHRRSTAVSAAEQQAAEPEGSLVPHTLEQLELDAELQALHARAAAVGQVRFGLGTRGRQQLPCRRCPAFAQSRVSRGRSLHSCTRVQWPPPHAGGADAGGGGAAAPLAGLVGSSSLPPGPVGGGVRAAGAGPRRHHAAQRRAVLQPGLPALPRGVLAQVSGRAVEPSARAACAACAGWRQQPGPLRGAAGRPAPPRLLACCSPSAPFGLCHGIAGAPRWCTAKLSPLAPMAAWSHRQQLGVRLSIAGAPR